MTAVRPKDADTLSKDAALLFKDDAVSPKDATSPEILLFASLRLSVKPFMAPQLSAALIPRSLNVVG